MRQHHWLRAFVLVTVLAVVSQVGSTVAVGAAPRPPGAGKPPAGTGMGTAAALNGPMCDKTQGPYGKLDWGIKGGLPTTPLGAICVAPWPEGKSNGGATYPGVTKDSVKVVVLLPNPQQLSAATRLPVNNATGTTGTVENAFKDAFAPYQAMFETYGRTVDVEYVTSSGDDEASQRADAIAVLAEKPFLVADGTYSSHGVFETQIAAAKVVVYGAAATFSATQEQAPYRWGGTNTTATAVNLAEFLGNQLVGKKAQWAGDAALQSEPRKFGVVSIDGVIEEPQFNSTMADHHVKIAEADWIKYPAGATGTTVDPAVAQSQAPLAIQRLKADGVTSVILFTNSAMTAPLLSQATANDYHPEWIITAYAFMNHPILSRSYDQDQWSHAFGISWLPPTASFVVGSSSSTIDVVKWYWGQGTGTSDAIKNSTVHWIMKSIMYAGPKLTPQTVRQGWFAIPAAGGAGDDQVFSSQSGYGRTTGLSYDDYQGGNGDFNLQWWDPDATTPGTDAKGAMFYVNGAQRYTAGSWPTKPLAFFDKATAIQVVDSPPEQPVPCPGCPSATGAGGSSTS